jgi:phosphohistidine swiveling domain-containing protein
MAASATSTALHFDPPGPGSWEQDPVHFPRPSTRYFQETHPPAFEEGTSDFARLYGMIINGLRMRYVNGFGYRQVLPAPEADIPGRLQRAEQVFAQKIWREQLRDWDENCKPSAIAKHRELQAVDPDALSDTELVAYLTRCRDHHSAMLAQHMRFTAGAVLPTGDFLAHVGDWTGIAASDLLGLMRGSAEVSAGGSDEMTRLKKAFADDPSCREVLSFDGEPEQVLARLRSLDGEAGAAVSGYLDLVGNRIINGFDIAEPTAIELPDALLRAMRVAITGEAQASDVDARIAEVRARVPTAHQDEFDQLLGEARLTYRLRDERGVYSDIWAAGLMRRATLGAGRRVAGRGRIATPQQMLDASLDEMCALVAGSGGGPSAAELARRAEYRATYTAKDVPPVLGLTPPPRPDLAALPPPAGRVMRAMLTALGHLFGSSQEQNEERLLYGLAASKGVYEGPARRVSGPAEFGRIVKGDVLVTESTTEAFNILLPLLGGIITDNGGLLSHAAIVSREYGIPGVVGTREATERIADGVLVRVDGDAGEVTVLG